MPAVRTLVPLRGVLDRVRLLRHMVLREVRQDDRAEGAQGQELEVHGVHRGVVSNAGRYWLLFGCEDELMEGIGARGTTGPGSSWNVKRCVGILNEMSYRYADHAQKMMIVRFLCPCLRQLLGPPHGLSSAW